MPFYPLPLVLFPLHRKAPLLMSLVSLKLPSCYNEAFLADLGLAAHEG